MAIKPVYVRPKKHIEKRQKELRDKLFPHLIDEGFRWVRQKHDGYSTIPKVMPLVMSIMDDLSKGQPVSSTYLELWCRSFDECFVSLAKHREMAFHAGFEGQRAERTWTARIKKLAALGFIEVAPGPSGPLSYAYIINPYLVIRRLKEQKTTGLTEAKYNALMARANEIGAADLEMRDPWATPPPLTGKEAIRAAFEAAMAGSQPPAGSETVAPKADPTTT